MNKLIRKVYDEFVAPDYSEQGNAFFYDWISPGKIAERQKDIINLFEAFADNVLIGMIEIRDDSYISLLFVDKNFHKMGIAKKLFRTALENCVKKTGQIEKFYVHASPYSIPVYQRLGFKESAQMQEENGIKYMPMEIELKGSDYIFI